MTILDKSNISIYYFENKIDFKNCVGLTVGEKTF